MKKEIIIGMCILIVLVGCVRQVEPAFITECVTDEDCDVKCEEFRLNINQDIAYCTCEFFQISFDSFCIPHFNNSKYQVKITSNIQDTNVTNCTIYTSVK